MSNSEPRIGAVAHQNGAGVPFEHEESASVEVDDFLNEVTVFVPASEESQQARKPRPKQRKSRAPSKVRVAAFAHESDLLDSLIDENDRLKRLPHEKLSRDNALLRELLNRY